MRLVLMILLSKLPHLAHDFSLLLLFLFHLLPCLQPHGIHLFQEDVPVLFLVYLLQLLSLHLLRRFKMRHLPHHDCKFIVLASHQRGISSNAFQVRRLLYFEMFEQSLIVLANLFPFLLPPLPRSLSCPPHILDLLFLLPSHLPAPLAHGPTSLVTSSVVDRTHAAYTCRCLELLLPSSAPPRPVRGQPRWKSPSSSPPFVLSP
mmetsp:Transcript_17938/g.40700  ORF Transcript_17938/g.40700 Transcript_17938/m.40700 type:complete len:204 (-) Transcript_17938:85-696(-)